MTGSSSKTTGGDPVAAGPPGATRPPTPGPADTGAPAANTAAVDQKVVSGDRNDRPPEP